MYTISKDINELMFNSVKSTKLFTADAKEVLCISLEKNSILPKHTSPRNAHLIMLEGSIDFHINEKVYMLETNDVFNFPKDEEHWVNASKNSKFLIIR